MSAPYREVSSRLKKLLSEGRVIEGSLYRSDRGNTPLHQLSDRATGRFRNIYILMQIAHNLWQLFNSTCLLPLLKKRKNRNMTQRRWAEVILQKLVARGIALALGEAETWGALAIRGRGCDFL